MSSVLGVVNDLVKDQNVPPEVIEKHVRKLQDSVGKLSGTVQDLPKHQFENLIAMARRPSDFVTQYKEASEKNIPNLGPMMGLLREISLDPKVKSNISKKSTGLSSYQHMKEKILQQVGPQSSVTNKEKLKKQTRLFPERPYLTLDFLPNDKVLHSKAGPLGNIPVQSQESAIIEDLLYCFVGVQGTHIIPVKHQTSQNVVFKIDETLDPTLKELLQRITPLCQHYSIVVQFAEDKMQLSSGRVNQALAGALYQLIQDYYVFITQLESQHKKGDLTLNRIWFYIQSTMETMNMLAEVCQTIDRMEARGGKTLSLLHQEFVLKSSNENCQAVAEFLATQSAKPYFEILTKWIRRGVIMDTGKDFFVEDNEIIELSALPMEYSDDYWERRYTVKGDQIPSFLHGHADMILKTGKYLNVIQQCDKSINYQDHEECRGAVIYKTNPEEYIQPLEKAYAFASKTLLELLVKDKDLIGHLKSVKHYFLLDQGDLIVQFMDLCESELLQSVNLVEPSRLESLLELAQRTSAANTDPYKDNVRVELLTYDLIFQIGKISSINTDEEAEFQTPANSEDLTGLEGFAFGYDVKWPISLVLNRKSLACYQMLLRHLFYCKHVERLLCSAWIVSKGTKPRNKEEFGLCASSFALRQKMLNFLQDLEYYMTFEVLEPNWEDMITKIRSGKVENVDQVLQIHTDFLSTCMNDCMLSSPRLLETVKKLLKICVKFVESVKENKDYFVNAEEAESFQENIKKFEFEFNSGLITLLDQVSQLGRENYNEKTLNILSRLNFNGHYSKMLELFGTNPMNVEDLEQED